jgi:hypothetical protein
MIHQGNTRLSIASTLAIVTILPQCQSLLLRNHFELLVFRTRGCLSLGSTELPSVG